MGKFVTLLIAFVGSAQALAAERTDKIFIQGNPAGTQTVRTESDGFVLALAQHVRGSREAADAALADLIANGRDQRSPRVGRRLVILRSLSLGIDFLPLPLIHKIRFFDL